MKQPPSSWIRTPSRVLILTILPAKSGTLLSVTHGWAGYSPCTTRTGPGRFESSLRVA